MKKLLICLLLTAVCLPLTAVAGARLGHPGYAVSDDNAMKEIQAIKLQLNSLTRDVKAVQDKTALQDRNSNEVRLSAQEAQLAELWKWLTFLFVIIILIVLSAMIVYVYNNVKGRRGEK